MKRKKQIFRSPYGLRARFAVSLGVSALISVLLFIALYVSSGMLLSAYCGSPGFTASRIARQGESLQEFISENGITGADLQKLEQWERRQPLILLEIHADGKCIYSSLYDDPEDVSIMEEISGSSEEHTVAVRLGDREAKAVLYSDFTYRYYVLSTAASAAAAIAVFILLFLRGTRRLISYVCRLNEEVQILEGGNLEYEVSVEGNDELTGLAESMNRMRESFRQQLETEQKLHRANRQLVTEMSHDLRTPLTGMMLYLEILRSRRWETEEELQDYLEKIDAKAQHMKQISDHLFEYSLSAASGGSQAPRQMREAFAGVLENFRDELGAQGFRVSFDGGWASCRVDVNDEYIRRIFGNIASNAVKYADPAGEIMICTIDTDRYCGFSVMNMRAAADEQTESSGIGIESIRTMMGEMNGSCTVEQTENTFGISLLFPRAEAR